MEPVGRQVPKPSTESQKSTGPQKRTTSQELDAEFESDVEDFNPKSYTCSWQGWFVCLHVSSFHLSLTIVLMPTNHVTCPPMPNKIAGCAKTFSTSGNLRRHRTLHLQNERRSTGEQSIRFSRPDSKTETSLMGTNTNARREAREPAGNRDRVPVSDEETESLQESGYVSSVEGVEMDDIKMTEPLGTTIGETADGEPAIDDGRTCESRSFVDGAEADDATLKGDTTISSLVEAVAKAVEAESPVSEMSIARLVEAAVEVA